jgi:2-C-methyl-D-erythritol 4-phosphate cytidylyltransferase
MEAALAETAHVSTAAVICAAGSSARMGGLKKEYCPMPAAAAAAGRPLTVLGAAVSAFAAVSAVEIIVISVPAGAETGETAARKALPPELLAAGSPRILFVSGGGTRRASVHHALSLLAAYRPRYVLIHDGARPWVSPSLIEQIIAAVQTHRAVIPLLPLTETPKETGAPFERASGMAHNGDMPVFIRRHLRRANTGTAQTPQAFAFPEILAAHEKAAVCEGVDRAEYTDDAEVWGAFCGPVAVIPGLPENRKITFPEDLL